MPLQLFFWFVMSPDKDQDGDFKWVDKSLITFSNYGAGWPRNTAGLWDCGQIFTGKTGSTQPWTDSDSWCQHPLSSSSLPGNYDGKWETTSCFKSLGYICEMTGGQNPKPTSAPGQLQ